MKKITTDLVERDQYSEKNEWLVRYERPYLL